MGTLRKREGREVWTAMYTDSDGIRREVSTGCKSKDAARQVLAGLEGRAEKIKSGIISRAEADTATWATTPLAQHVNDYIAALRGKGVTAKAAADRGSYLRQVVAVCRWTRLCEMNRTQAERWLSGQVDAGKSARWHNHRVTTVGAFANWLVREGRIAVNPFPQMRRRNEKADPRHQRRALSVPELAALFDAAERRPLEDASKNRGSKAELSPTTVDKLQWLGRTRSILWRTLAYTGLRLGEARSITLAQVHLDAAVPYLELRARDEKARRGAQIALQADLAAMLGEYIAERRARLLGQRGASNNVIPFRGDIDGAPVFHVPAQMTRVFDYDLKGAGIPKHDGADRVVDVHCLRHTFGTMLAKSGVSLQVAQRAMRHSDPSLTANIYTHLDLGDIGAAIAALPVASTSKAAKVATAGEDLRPLQRPQFGRISVSRGAIPCTQDNLQGECAPIAGSGEKPSISGDFGGFENGAGHGVRTRDIQLGKLALYQLS